MMPSGRGCVLPRRLRRPISSTEAPAGTGPSSDARLMGRVGSAGDNAAMESFFSLLTKNILIRQTWDTRGQLRITVVTWTNAPTTATATDARPRSAGRHHRVRTHHDPDRRSDGPTTVTNPCSRPLRWKLVWRSTPAVAYLSPAFGVVGVHRSGDHARLLQRYRRGRSASGGADPGSAAGGQGCRATPRPVLTGPGDVNSGGRAT